jgi:hypothetical protein
MSCLDDEEMFAAMSVRFRHFFQKPLLPSGEPSFADYFSRNADRIFALKDKSKWLIVHPTANLQRERNTFRAAQLWKVIRVSDLLTLIGTFYSAGITFDRPVAEAPRISYCGVGHERLYIEEMPAVPDFVMAIYRETVEE